MKYRPGMVNLRNVWWGGGLKPRFISTKSRYQSLDKMNMEMSRKKTVTERCPHKALDKSLIVQNDYTKQLSTVWSGRSLHTGYLFTRWSSVVCLMVLRKGLHLKNNRGAVCMFPHKTSVYSFSFWLSKKETLAFYDNLQCIVTNDGNVCSSIIAHTIVDAYKLPHHGKSVSMGKVTLTLIMNKIKKSKKQKTTTSTTKVLTSAQQTKINTCAISVDQDVTARKEPSHRDLLCVLFY